MLRFQDDEILYFLDQYNKIHLLLEVSILILKWINHSRFESFSFPKKRKLMYVFLENCA